MLARHRYPSIGYLALILLGLLGLGLQSPPTAEEPEGTPDSPAESTEMAEPADESPTAEVAPAEEEEDESSLKGKVISVKVSTRDLTEGGRSRALRQLMKQASEDKASALIFELSTKSGYTAEMAGLLLDAIPEVEVPTYALVSPTALGAGALLALNCDEIYMSPSAVMGAAMPSGMEATSGSDDEEATVSAESSQAISVIKAQLRSGMEAKGRNADLAVAMVDPSFELKVTIGGEEKVLAKEGEVLTLTATEASQLVDGEPLLAAGIAKSPEEIVKAAKLKGELFVTNGMDWRHDLDRQKVAQSDDDSSEETSEDGTDKVAKGEGEAKDGEEEEVVPLFGRQDKENYAGKIVVLKVGEQDLVSTARFEFMKRVIEKARDEKAAALILDVNTPGGYLWQTLETMMVSLQDLPFQTYTFVNPAAISAGSMLAIATDHIYMKPASTIGSALAVQGGGQDIEGAMQKKIQSLMIATVRNVAINKGHDPDVCLAFIRDDTRVVREGVVITDVGEVLNLNAIEATEIYNGRPLLAKGIVNSIEEIIEQEGLQGEVLEVRASPLERFAQWVQLFSVILIAIGLAGAYTEMNAPGFGLPGFISVIAFTTFFFGNYFAGNLAGYETAVVFVIGMLLVVLELLVLGGSTVVIGAIGTLLMLGSLGFALVSRFDFSDMVRGGEQAPSIISVFRFPALTLTVALMLGAVLIVLLMRFLPGIKLFNSFILESSIGSTGNPQLHDDAKSADDKSKHDLLGVEGKAESDLRPTGLARIEGKVLDVTTDSVYVERGARVKVTAVYGDRIVVDEVKEEEDAEAAS